MPSDLMVVSARRDIKTKDQAMKLASQEVKITKQYDRIQFLEGSLQRANLKLLYLKTTEPTRDREFGEKDSAAMVFTATLESYNKIGIRQATLINTSPPEVVCKRPKNYLPSNHCTFHFKIRVDQR